MLSQPIDPEVPRKRWKQRLKITAIGVPCALALVSLGAIAIRSPDTSTKLTHTISRGDLVVTVSERGLVESVKNTEIKCKVRGKSTVIWIIASGTYVKPGDELFRLDPRLIEEEIDERNKFAFASQSAAENSKSKLVHAELAVGEYEKGRYVKELISLEKDLVVAQTKLSSAREILRYTRQLAESRYVSELEVEEKEFEVRQAALDEGLKKTQLEVLKKFTKAEELEKLRGDLAAAQANYKADKERATADSSRRDRALAELKNCVIKAEVAGLVVHQTAAQWEASPIEEGSTVHKDQVLLLIPDLSRMQVKVGIPQASVSRVKVGQHAKVTITDRTLDGTISSVASVARPGGWWSGNVTRYDTTLGIPADARLMPNMSADVEVLVARHENVLLIPVAAVAAIDGRNFCWLKTTRGSAKRQIELGDSNGVFTIVKEGLGEGDEVLLNPPSTEDQSNE